MLGYPAGYLEKSFETLGAKVWMLTLSVVCELLAFLTIGLVRRLGIVQDGVQGCFDLVLRDFTDRMSGFCCQLAGLACQRADQAVLLAGQFAQLLTVEFAVGFSQALAEAEQAGDGVGLGAYEEITGPCGQCRPPQCAWTSAAARADAASSA
ncbi:hypothetical protein OHA61_39690 [Streptomyces sp. NBC_00885]|uniref:hypothetical protein n=1 Tax=Streptomyces sp. NBC_00885 TaxID=2975857 RepID=UPI003864435C|nr:hypothetical protein OHA61_00115 [Streptomyces sp. NBC_00885]WSY72133.1 hypothetical protein OHA61_39690 [Streptomyces sp. NBC_00885]